ncbi:MAG: VCBS repeat-containing protein, partial [Oscillospiraceae bacterium]|nr:VCBS repeat-containing protein [Oscillospiraceae bacterium]
QRVIDGVLKSGAVYSAPTSGSYRQSVQLYDINGDGVNEAVAFFRFQGEKPLRIYIFSQNEESYEVVATIDGDGTSIGSISYVDMDGDGWSEIAVGWHMGTDLDMLGVYALKGFKASAIVLADYDQYTSADMDGDGNAELMVLRERSGEKSGDIELYSVNPDGETETASARLSAGMETISRLAAGTLTDGRTALFAEGAYMGSGLISDIFVFDGTELKNITVSPETGDSEGTKRSYAAYCRDIDSDGIMELPVTRQLRSKTDTVYRVLDWYCWSSEGETELKLTTYHNYTDSWYLVLPEQWRDSVTIRREDSSTGERGVIFSRWNGDEEPVTDFLAIYAITGENREDMAKKDERVVLYRSSDTVYAALLLCGEDEVDFVPDYPYLKNAFGRIYSEWITGVN